jgi:uncharacterized protein YgbK (DUF1537 family)
MPYSIVIADDVTGANDIGIMYTKGGHNSAVYSYDKLQPKMEFYDDVVIIDTNSRFLSYEEAYQRVYEATKRFDKHDIHQFVDKQCSVFRGNIGAEFDAMMDALEENFAIVVLGFPDNGRTTLHSIHYVHGVKLEDSQFNQDPVHPMKQSNLVKILQSQTKRKVSAIPYEVLDLGVDYLKDQIGLRKTDSNYVIIDVRNNEDLSIIAQAVKEEKVICGSSALSFYLGLLQDSNSAEDELDIKGNKNRNEKILCIAGSLTPQTKLQIEYIKKQNYPVIMLDTTKLFTEEDCYNEKKRILIEYEESYKTTDLVLIHSMNEKDEVQRTKDIALGYEIDNTEVSEMVSNTLSELAKSIGDKYDIDKYIICGGDTSASFCNRLNIVGMKVLEEIEAGLPTCQSITEPYYQLVLKSGSFGSEQFIEKAKDVLNKKADK